MAVPSSSGELGLSILGLGAEYPPYDLKSDSLEILSQRYYPDSPSMKKVLSINRFTGIETRSSIGTPDHPIVNQPAAPSIAELHKVFISDGVPLAVRASRKALAEARVDPSQLTHMVSTTCTDSANPGYDHFVARELGIGPDLEKVLLHGVGCSGGLAALRTAANLCLGHTMRGLPARILVLALEVSTTMVRSELDSINALQETRIGVALFSDCASAVILSNGLHDDHDHGNNPAPEPVYDLLGWNHRTLPDTEADLGFDVDPSGWKVVLSPRVPQIAQSAIRPSYDALLSSLSSSASSNSKSSKAGSAALLPDDYREPADFDWAMHPGGATILTGAERAMGITPEHMRASYDTYMSHGNSSSATIFSVLDRLRAKDMDAMTPGGRGPREYVLGCAFGPGICVETCMLRRRGLHHSSSGNGGADGVSGLQTPPETESEVSSRTGEEEEEDQGEAGKARAGKDDEGMVTIADETGSGSLAVEQGKGAGLTQQSPRGSGNDDTRDNPNHANGGDRSNEDALVNKALATMELD